MTEKKEKQKEKMEGDISPIENDKNGSETSKIAENSEAEDKEESEVKLLEYFSKNELVEKIKNLEKELELKTEQVENSKDWKQKFMHLQAEFENAQKRWNKNRNDLRLEYTASVLKKFLPLYDSYKKAIDDNPDNEDIKQFYNQFLNIINAHDGASIMKININDPFDYHYHEALSSIERDDLPNNTIIDIIQDGWMLGKDVLRYAKVVTSRKPKPAKLEIKTEEKEEPKNIEGLNISEDQNTENEEKSKDK